MKVSSQNNGHRLAQEFDAAMNKGLTFADQFNSFIAQNVSIGSEEEVAIPNQLKNKNGKKIIPSTWQVIDCRGASSGSLGRGEDNEWTEILLYLKNFSVTDGVFSIRFFERASDE